MSFFVCNGGLTSEPISPKCETHCQEVGWVLQWSRQAPHQPNMFIIRAKGLPGVALGSLVTSELIKQNVAVAHYQHKTLVAGNMDQNPRFAPPV